MDEHLVTSCKVVDAITVNAGAAGTSAINGATLDMSGFTGVMVVLKTGPIVSGAVTSMKVEQSAASNMGSATDITGSSQTIADDANNTIFITDIIRPELRYVRLVVSRGTQAATVTATYHQYGADNRPVTQPATVVTVEKFKDPIGGTA